jgi:hypothetical protein
MTETGAGTVIMIAVAAALWFLYLLPTWVRRREYLATERTATRLQQTMRIMAETAEVPEPVRVAVSTREAARQERLLRAEQRRADAITARQVEAIRRSTPRVVRRPDARAADALRRRRMRRTRAGASLALLTATGVALVQLGLMMSTGVAPGAWLVLGGALAVAWPAIAVQRRLDALAARAVSRPQRVAHPTTVDVPLEVAPARRAWTPVAVPRPVYLSRPEPQHAAPAADSQRLLREAAARSEEALRAARAEPEVVPFRPSRFASMGFVDPAAVSPPDLDEVLRRRRTAG